MPAALEVSMIQGSAALVLSFRNKTGSTIAAGTVVKYDGTNDAAQDAPAGMTATTATTDIPIGITIEAVLDGQDGRVAASGMVVQAVAKNAVTFGQSLMPGATAGTTSTRTTLKPYLGKCLRTAADAAVTLVLVNIVDAT